MPSDRRKRLEALSGWSWNTLDDRWKEGFSRLKEFLDRYGHCRVPKSYRCEDSYRLGRWAAVQRRTRDKMDIARRQRLEAVRGWIWDVLSDQWENSFSHLKQFSDREGHCRVPLRYKTDDGYLLGSWIYDQKANRDKIDSDRQKRLEALPAWTWKIGK
jgi:hypothetical protein